MIAHALASARRRRLRAVGLIGLGLTLASSSLAAAAEPTSAPADPEAERTQGAAPPRALWVDRQTLVERPTEGPAWAALRRSARQSIARPNLSNQDDPTNVRILARALVFARTGDDSLRREVVGALERVRGTERSASALAVARELVAYVIAADLVGLAGDERRTFETWLRELRDRSFRGRTLRSTHEDRPNNWGTHAGATRIAVAIYLGDDEELARAAHVFAGWLGERSGWRGFEFGEASWQAGWLRRYAVNPVGASRRGHSIDGVLPDDQRRGGRFRWPPPRENYVYEALQGAVTQAVLLERQGYPAWQWGDRAILRAFRWLHDQADFPAQGDDTWLPHIVNHVYGTDFPAPVPSRPGKGMGFADWTHGAATAARPEEVTAKLEP